MDPHAITAANRIVLCCGNELSEINEYCDNNTANCPPMIFFQSWLQRAKYPQKFGILPVRISGPIAVKR